MLLIVFFVVFAALSYESLLQWVVKFGARLCPSSAILVHSWDISFSILEHSKECWGSLEASRGGMLEVIGAYVEGFATWAGGFLRSPRETQK